MQKSFIETESYIFKKTHKTMKKFSAALLIILCISIFFAAASVFAQQPIPIGPGDGDGSTVPIGGLAVLAALGGGYAVKKLNDKKNK